MIRDLPGDVRSALDSYSLNALKTMLRWRSEHWREQRTKADCLEELRRCLLDPTSIRDALKSCDALTREALALLRRKGGAMPVAAMCGQLATWHPALPAAEVRRVPTELVRRALAFWHTGSSAYGPTMHDALRPAGENLLGTLLFSAPEILDRVAIPPDLGRYAIAPVAEGRPETAPGQSQRRILSFLRAIEGRAPRVLRSGQIGARDRAAVAALVDFGGSDSSAAAASGSNATGEADQPINFLCRTLRAAGLLDVSSDQHLRSTAAALRFGSLSPVRESRLLLQAWLDSADNGVVGLPHLRVERRASAATSIPDDNQVRLAYGRLVETLRRQIRPGQWYDVADLSRAIRFEDVEFLVSWRDPSPYHWSSYLHDPDTLETPSYVGLSLEDSRGRPRTLVMGADWELVEGAFIRATIEGPLTWLGLVELGAAKDRLSFGLTRLGAQTLEIDDSLWGVESVEATDRANSLVVQPNFEVLVYDPAEHAELLYQIDRFAELLSVDRIAVYRLTRDALCNGLQLGLRFDDVRELLEGAGRTPVPQNVAVSLRDWAAKFESVRLLRNCWLLEAPDEPTLDRWLVDPRIAGSVERRVSPTLALVVGGDPSSLRAALNRLGDHVSIVNANNHLTPCAAFEDSTTLRIEDREANLYTRAAVAAFADHGARPDDTYHLSGDSVQRAKRVGWTAERVLEILERVTGGNVPPGSRLRVRGWIGAVGPVDIGPVALFVAPDAETMRDARADPELAAAFIATVSATTGIVRIELVDRLRAALAGMGIETNRLADGGA